MRAQWGIPQPCSGMLLRSGHRASGVRFAFDTLIAPGIENELCLTLGATLRGPGVTAADGAEVTGGPLNSVASARSARASTDAARAAQTSARRTDQAKSGGAVRSSAKCPKGSAPIRATKALNGTRSWRWTGATNSTRVTR